MIYPTLSGPEKPNASGKPPQQLVVFLHGLGADGNDLIGLSSLFAQVLPDAYFISPNAPFPCDMAPFGYQWFSLLDRREDKVLTGVQSTYPILSHFLDTQLKRFNLKENQLLLIGFSQGTMMSLYTSLRRHEACAGVLGFSGALVGGDLLINELRSKPPVCLVHGTHDEIVPFSAMRQAESVLRSFNIAIETHARPGLGHGIDPEGIEIGKAFLKNSLVTSET